MEDPTYSVVTQTIECRKEVSKKHYSAPPLPNLGEMNINGKSLVKMTTTDI